MKKFKFSLEKLLDIRMKKEDLAKREFSAMLAQQEKEKLALEGISTTINAKNADRKNQRNKVVSAVDEMFFSNYLVGLNNKKLQQDFKLKQVMNETEKKRVVVVEKSKERKVIETLKDKKLAAYKIEADKEEQKMIDEISTMRAARKNLDISAL